MPSFILDLGHCGIFVDVDGLCICALCSPSVNWLRNNVQYSGFPVPKNRYKKVRADLFLPLFLDAKYSGVKRLIESSLNGPIFITQLECRTRMRFPDTFYGCNMKSSRVRVEGSCRTVMDVQR